jgi:hypothetical protein
MTRRTLTDLIDTYEEIAQDKPQDWWTDEDHAVKNTYLDVVRDLKALL